MIKYSSETVFNVQTHGIVNTINLVGVMGKGIALEFALRYPDMFKEYKQLCDNKQLKMGNLHYYEAKDGHIIINFPTKYSFKYPAQLSWIEAGLKDFVNTYKIYGIDSVAFPKLGCGLGQLDWSVVSKLMEQYLSDIDCDVIICEDSNPHAAGKEAEMVSLFNNCIDNKYFPPELKLPQKQIDTLFSNGHIQRFWKLGTIRGIGSTSYARLFSVFYNGNFDAFDPCYKLPGF